MSSNGNRLALLMEQRGLKRYEIGALCKRDSTTVTRWISGDIPIPDEAKRLLTEEFGVSVEYLMGWDRHEAKASAA